MEWKRLSEYGWLDAATQGIRFKPDRIAVREELRAHLEDKQADLRRIFPDISPEEAERRALESMGDPEKLSRELAKIHKPWLGWLWRLSQVALAAVLLALVLVGANAVMGGGSGLGGWYHRESGRRETQDGAVFLAPVKELAVLEGCTLSVPRAVAWTGTESKELEVALRVEDLRFWRKGGGQFELVWGEDNLGGRYSSQYEWNELGFGWEQGYISVLRDGWGPFHQTYLLRVSGIDPRADRVRLNYAWLGRSFSLTVDLTEEAGT